MNEKQNIKRGKKLSRFGRHPQEGYTSLACVWIEKDGELFLGGGRVMLLEKLGESGSIAAAAKSMNLNYRSAWLWIEEMNRLASAPLVQKIIGGKGGGCARLTEEGYKAIAFYNEFRAQVDKTVKTMNSSRVNNINVTNPPSPQILKSHKNK
jgi:molybdate transport system regulatory protein